ncbi:glycosyltransferase [Halorubrum ezzemoulense]|uniref:glycosyltransferase n=1 Tax=Halorubrum ezzemoulense TaxID=337243 RepID=UPI0023311CBE|nr:glycosyltransferase [Halorubrum ezzemoulense]MDB9249149.1 glycosyltransferase [Halorubrum ezzemoulense]MDB9259695.1 glycosyltransferase [Halorubrum ezzemoulense]MDB9263160.1 glycosyltransferase [Halorubrum ezzemoulense]MDB9266410.1 glycosyltransferase [Halorubrum ezzemoulense]MDB9270056.1 glycosyltransferase [Halorubrum ezzemoulense]
MASSIKIGIVTNIPSPYRIPLFNSIAERNNVSLTVYFMDVTEKNRSWSVSPAEWEFEYVFLDGSTWYSSILDRSISVNWGVVPRFRKASHDVIVVGGYNHTTCWITFAYSKFSGTPVVPWSGAWSGSIRINNLVMNMVRQKFTQLGQAWIAYGSRSASALSSWGADESRTHIGINTVSVEKFRGAAESYSHELAEDKFTLLYVGQLIARKNVELVLDALESIPKSDIQFIVVGDGPRESYLRSRADTLENSVEFKGFVERDQLYSYYTEADAFILPSKNEVWGLVVNEALACGTPVLVSDQCGCAPDLIREGFNGSIFQPDEQDNLMETLEELVAGSQTFASPGQIRKDAVQRFDIDASVDGFIRACRDAVVQ